MSTSPQQLLFVPRVLWAALTASVGVYAAVPFFTHAVAQEAPAPVLVLVFAAIAVVLAVVSFVLPVRMYRASLARATFEVEERPVAEAPSGYRSASGRYRVLLPSFRRKALALFFTPFILQLALSESVGIFGLLTVLVGHPYWMGVPFFAASFVLLALRFPTERAYVAPVEAAADAVAPPS